MASDSENEVQLNDSDDGVEEQQQEEQQQEEQQQEQPEVVTPSSRKPQSSHGSEEALAGSSSALLVGGAIALLVVGLGFLFKKLSKPKKKARLPPSKRAATTPVKKKSAAATAPEPAAAPAPATTAAAVPSSSQSTPSASPSKPASSSPRLPQRPALPQRPVRKAAPQAAAAAVAAAPAAAAPAPSSAPAPAAPAPAPAAQAAPAPSPAAEAEKPHVVSHLHADAKPFYPHSAHAPEPKGAEAAAAPAPAEAEPAPAPAPVVLAAAPAPPAPAPVPAAAEEAEAEEAAPEPSSKAPAEEAPAVPPAAATADVDDEPQQQQEEAEEEEHGEVQPAAVVKGKQPRAPKPEEPEKEESIADYTVPALSFEGCPAQDTDLSEVEQKARQMSVHAAKLMQSRNLAQAVKEQRAATELLLSPEAAGKVRPALLVNCSLALADMTLAQRHMDETKRWLALAHAAAGHLQVKGAVIHALMNYAFVVKSEGKRVSARRAYEQALAVAHEAFGTLHPTVEKVKYELIAHLVKCDEQEKAVGMMLAAADELLAEADKLEKEEAEQEGEKAAEEKAGEGEAADGAAAEAAVEAGAAVAAAAAANGEAAADGEQHEEGEGEEEKEPAPSKMARHFAVRNLMNAAGVRDNQKQFEQGEAILNRALELAVAHAGENSIQEMNVLSALAQHYKRRGQPEKAIELYDRVLSVMDERISVYDPDTLRDRVAILRDTAVLLKEVGRYEDAIDYATGALVNCQTLLTVVNSGRPVPGHPMLEQFHNLLAELKDAMGDAEGAAESRRAALQGRLSFQQVQRGRGGRAGATGGRGGRRGSSTGAATTRAGGRRK